VEFVAIDVVALAAALAVDVVALAAALAVGVVALAAVLALDDEPWDELPQAATAREARSMGSGRATALVRRIRMNMALLVVGTRSQILPTRREHPGASARSTCVQHSG
jgi:hypothetical protein